MDTTVERILRENSRRLRANNAPFDPVTGEGSVGERVRLEIPDFALPVQWVPKSMAATPLIKKITRHKTLSTFLLKSLKTEPSENNLHKASRAVIRLRLKHDFPFWAATTAYIKPKGGGDDILFRLTRPQRRLVEMFEKKRLAGEPIRVILLKARQWGGSTTSQLYMAWLQLMHRKGLNSLIISQVLDGSAEIKDMFARMMDHYPIELLHEEGERYSPQEAKLEGVASSQNIQRIPARNCKIKLGTARNPDSCRGGDYNLVHLSEVGVWTRTEGKSPEDIVRSACSGILLKPYTMIVYESTANGTGNFFQTEYAAAKDTRTKSQFEPLFISWFDIDPPWRHSGEDTATSTGSHGKPRR